MSEDPAVVARVEAAMANHRWSTAYRPNPSTEDEIQTAEDLFGFRFPDSLRAFWKRAISPDGMQFNLHQQVNTEGFTWGAGPVQMMLGPNLRSKGDSLYLVDISDSGEGQAYMPQWGDQDPYRNWLRTKVHKIAEVQRTGYSPFVLDFGFDPIDPPVIYIDGEAGGDDRRVDFAASNFLTMLGHPTIAMVADLDGLTEHEIDNVSDTLLAEAEHSKEPSERRLSWYDYRDSQIQPERAVAAHRY